MYTAISIMGSVRMIVRPEIIYKVMQLEPDDSGAAVTPWGGSCCILLKSLINLLFAGVDIFDRVLLNGCYFEWTNGKQGFNGMH